MKKQIKYEILKNQYSLEEIRDKIEFYYNDHYGEANSLKFEGTIEFYRHFPSATDNSLSELLEEFLNKIKNKPWWRSKKEKEVDELKVGDEVVNYYRSTSKKCEVYKVDPEIVKFEDSRGAFFISKCSYDTFQVINEGPCEFQVRDVEPGDYYRVPGGEWYLKSDKGSVRMKDGKYLQVGKDHKVIDYKLNKEM